MIKPSVTEHTARQALDQNRVFDEHLVRGLLADIERLRAELEQLESKKAARGERAAKS